MKNETEPLMELEQARTMLRHCSADAYYLRVEHPAFALKRHLVRITFAEAARIIAAALDCSWDTTSVANERAVIVTDLWMRTTLADHPISREDD